MSDNTTISPVPSRLLYTMQQVGDLDNSLAFYREPLDMREKRQIIGDRPQLYAKRVIAG
jgi:hypothetical protein